MSLLPPPNVFGLPDKFSDWRQNQDVAVLEVVDGQQRFNLQVCPTGFGKSLSYIMMSVLMGKRAILLTSTKGLQSQLLRDFESVGAVDVRGRNAYRCVKEIDGTMCDKGACTYGYKCPLKLGGCLYHDAVIAAKKAPIVITNYTFWFTINEHTDDGLGDFSFMVCDEAHDTPETVSSYLTIVLDLTDKIIEAVLPRREIVLSSTVPEWKIWAKEKITDVRNEIEAQRELLDMGMGDKKRYRRFMAFEGLLRKMIRMEDDWIIGATDWSIEFAPKWPAPYCEEILFLQTPRILLTSASVREKTAQMLGIVDAEDIVISEYPHTFPVANRMLYYIPVVPPIRMNYKTTDEELRRWVKHMDLIIGPRLDRKGIIHTVSYTRRDLIISQSKYADKMITHQRKNTVPIVEKFKKSSAPKILVSPSMTTGWDFPFSECEFQIIGKLAFPDLSNPLVAARKKEDKEYIPYITMQQLVQAVGRGSRAEDDSCETFCTDAVIQGFMRRYGKFAPDYFIEAYNERATIPRPAPKIRRK